MSKLLLADRYSKLRVIPLFVILFLSLVGATCQSSSTNSSGTSNAKTGVPIYTYEIVKVFPHDTAAFTQGLISVDGNFIESTGEVGRSTLRRVEPETGKILQRVDVPVPYFAEGATLLKGKIYQLTWQDGEGFIYDALSFDKIGDFKYAGEGWGLTTDGQSLILSDGTNRIRFLDPNTFQVTRTIVVTHRGAPLTDLNELEYVQGEIFANVWHANRIARINPQTGAVVGWIDLSGIISPGELHDEEAVLNGIAYDEAHDRLFVTGKLWPKLFEIKLKQK